jgi:HSP20 family molecular chaperone IbpA
MASVIKPERFLYGPFGPLAGPSIYPTMYPPTTEMIPPGLTTPYPTWPYGPHVTSELAAPTMIPPHAAYYPSWPGSVSNIIGTPTTMPGGNANWYNDWYNFITTNYTRPATGGLYNVNFRPGNWTEFYTLTNPVRLLDREGNRILFLAFDMRGYKPEEIKITLNKGERSIVVEANYENKDMKEHQIMRRFYRKFVLPEYLKSIDLGKIELHSALNVNGLLTIEAQLPKMTREELAKWGGEMHAHNLPYSPVTCKPVISA